MIISHLCELGIGCYTKFVKELDTKLLAGLCTIMTFFLFWGYIKNENRSTNKAPIQTIGPSIFLHKLQLWKSPVSSI